MEFKNTIEGSLHTHTHIQDYFCSGMCPPLIFSTKFNLNRALGPTGKPVNDYLTFSREFPVRWWSRRLFACCTLTARGLDIIRIFRGRLLLLCDPGVADAVQLHCHHKGICEVFQRWVMWAHIVEFKYRLGGEEVEYVECSDVLKQGRITKSS